MTRKGTQRSAAKELLSPEEVATYLGCGRSFAYQLLARGELPSLKLGRLRKVRRADVEAFVERRLGTGR